MNGYFDFERIKKLVVRQVLLNYRGLIMMGGAIAAILLFIAVPFTGLGLERTPYEILFLCFYGLIAILGTNGLFADIYRKEKNIEYMMLPASTEEKFIVKLVVNVILLPAFLMLIFLAASAVAQLLNMIIWGVSAAIFNPATNYIWIAFPHIIVAQSLFILGASIFRKMSVVKTVLSLWGLSFVLSIIAGLIFRIVFNQYFHGWQFDDLIFAQAPSFLMKWEKPLTNTAITMYYLMVPFFYLTSYFRMKEVQVSDGV